VLGNFRGGCGGVCERVVAVAMKSTKKRIKKKVTGTIWLTPPNPKAALRAQYDNAIRDLIRRRNQLNEAIDAMENIRSLMTGEK